jgi:hypothetical protein
LVFLHTNNLESVKLITMEYGDWHVIYARANRWAAKGIMEGIYRMLQRATPAAVPINAVSLDSTIVKVHPDGCGALKKGAVRRQGGVVAD